MARLLFFSGVLTLLFGLIPWGSLLLIGAFVCVLIWLFVGPKGHWL
jgi:hypothetical protein